MRLRMKSRKTSWKRWLGWLGASGLLTLLSLSLTACIPPDPSLSPNQQAPTPTLHLGLKAFVVNWQGQVATTTYDLNGQLQDADNVWSVRCGITVVAYDQQFWNTFGVTTAPPPDTLYWHMYGMGSNAATLPPQAMWEEVQHPAGTHQVHVFVADMVFGNWDPYIGWYQLLGGSTNQGQQYSWLSGSVLPNIHRVLAHELGHVMNVFHSALTDRLMYPKGPPIGTKIDSYDCTTARASQYVY